MNPSTLSHPATVIDAQAFKTAPLRISCSVRLSASLQTVFDYVADPVSLCAFMPGLFDAHIRHEVAGTASGPGAIRVCDFGNDMIVEETIVTWSPPFAYAYQIARPNPFGLCEHLGVFTCHPVDAGTILSWRQYFDHADLPAIHALMIATLDGAMQNLIVHFGGEVLDLSNYR